MWTQKKVNNYKQEIKAELDSFEKKSERLAFIIKEADRLQVSADSDNRLKCIIFIISGFVHHIRFGGLKENQIRKLRLLFLSILQIENIQPQKSRFSFFYSELHSVLSQIYRKEGEHWKAAWEEQSAEKTANVVHHGNEGFLRLSMGIRALRLGHIKLAWHELNLAEEEGLSGRQFYICRIEKVKILRFQRHYDEANGLIEQSLSDSVDEFSRELLWERRLIKTLEKDDVTDVVTGVRKGKTHNSFSYIMDAFLISRIVAETKWIDRFPTMQSLAYNPRLVADKKKFLYQYCLTLADCYDTDIPLKIRAAKLGDHLARARDCLTVDQELYVWLSATRWLARSHQFRLAALCLAEYEALSMKLTLGKFNNALVWGEDLLARDWYREFSMVGDAI